MQQATYFTFGLPTDTPPALDLRLTLPRGDEAQALVDLLCEPQTRAVLLTGTAGVGKSTLAALVFDRFQSHTQEGLPEFHSYTWLRVGPRTTWPDISRALLNALQNTSRADSPDLSQQASTQMLFELLRRPDQPALIVLDQCEELFERAGVIDKQETPYAVGAGLSGAVRFLELLQQDFGASRILLTCAQSPFGSDYRDALNVRTYLVGGLTIVEGLHLLQQRGVLGLQQDLSTLWQRCSGHTFTLIVFCALKNLSGFSLHYLLDSPAYQRLWEGTVLPDLCEALLGFFNPMQLALVRSLSLFREAVPLAGPVHLALAEGESESEGEGEQSHLVLPAYEQEMSRLVALGLVESIRRDDGQKGYLLHPLLARYVQDHYLASEQRGPGGYLASSLGVANRPAETPENQEARQIALAAGHMRVADYYARAARQLCPPAGQRGSPNEVVPYLAMLEHLCLGWHWQTAYDQLCALELDEDLARWGMWHTLICLYEAMVPPLGALTRRDEGLAYSALALLYSKLGEFEQSRTYYTSALAVQRGMGDRRNEALTLTNQGEFLRVLGDHEQARRNFEQALALTRDEDDPELACLLAHNMALLAQEQRDYAQSLRYFLQALQLARQSRLEERESLILTNLGLLLCAQQRYQDGLALLLPALQTRQARTPARHDPQVAALLTFLSKLEQRMGSQSFTNLCQAARQAGQQEQVLRVLTH